SRPPVFRVEELSACENRSNTCGRNSGLIPQPVSLTVISIRSRSRNACAQTRPPESVNLMVFDNSLSRDWPQLDLRPHPAYFGYPRIGKALAAQNRENEDAQTAHLRHNASSLVLLAHRIGNSTAAGRRTILRVQRCACASYPHGGPRVKRLCNPNPGDHGGQHGWHQ